VAAAAAEALCYLGEVDEGLRVLVSLIENGNEQACSALEGFLKNAGPVEAIKPHLPALRAIAASNDFEPKVVRFAARSILLDAGEPKTTFDLYKTERWE